MGIPSNPNPPLPSFTKGGNKNRRRHKWRLYTNGQAQDLPLQHKWASARPAPRRCCRMSHARQECHAYYTAGQFMNCPYV
ncbi:MAG: hypothetical protein L0Y68_07840, partial [Candidatus Dadabacteria bacterium]|nr:hypothetical protein [Candidatus Dadabacteria bacterium]